MTNISVDLANWPVPDNFMAVVTRTRQYLRFLSALICTVGWHGDVHAQDIKSSTPSLEVVGEIRMEAQLEPLDETRLRLSGTLTDEVGHPISATLLVEVESGPEAHVVPCGNPGKPSAGAVTSLLSVPSTGEICGVVLGRPDALKLLAQAPHYIPAEALVSHASPNHLAPPRFTKAPQTMRLGVSVSLELLVGSGANQLPTDARVFLHLLCPHGSQLLGERPAAGLPLIRFEATPDATSLGGACQLSAVIKGGSQSSPSATRNVLVRDQANLNLKSLEVEQNKAHLLVGVQASSRGVDTGVIEARSGGAFLVGAAVENGLARLEITQGPNPMELHLTYLPSDESLVPGPSITATIPRMGVAKTWTGAHLVGLIAFAGWLVFAWLRPRSLRLSSSQGSPSPRKAGVKAQGSTKGKVEGLVCDVHTGHPIPGALLILSAPGPVERNELERRHSRQDGTFEFQTSPEAHSLMRLRVEGEGHLSLETTITSRQLTIHLTEKRRALIQHLVAWAKNRGSPWYRRAPPTPGEVEETAITWNEPQTEAWAGAVGRAVYSGLPLSEQEVDNLQSPETSADGGSKPAN